MHGNTESTSNGYKTRRFRNIRSELEQAFDLHAAAGTRLAAAHFWLHTLGLPVFMTGLGLMVTRKVTLEPVIAGGASAVLLGLVCLAINLWRRL